MISPGFREELKRTGQAWYDSGYADGVAGRVYTGKTFIGYYGWCDGRDAESASVSVPVAREP